MAAAGVDVHGGEVVLGPCMDGEMGLRDDDHAGDAARGESVEYDVEDHGPSGFGRCDHAFLDSGHVAESGGGAAVQLDKEVPSKGAGTGARGPRSSGRLSSPSA